MSRGHVTIAQLRSRHQREERRLVLGALERNGWSLSRTAEDIEVAEMTLRDMIRRHDLEADYSEHNAGRGRPRGSASTGVKL